MYVGRCPAKRARANSPAQILRDTKCNCGPYRFPHGLRTQMRRGRSCHCGYILRGRRSSVNFNSIGPEASQPKEKSFEITQVSGDGFDLCPGQTVCERET